MGYNPEKITEETAWNSEDSKSVYAITKYEAEMEVWRGIQEGVPSVIVNPGVILGPGFFESGSGGLFKRVHSGLRYATHGVAGYVGVVDVIKSMVLLMNSDYKNERYIIVAENLSSLDFITLISNAFNLMPPKKIARQWMLAFAWRLDWLKHKITGGKRRLTKNLCKTLRTKSYYSSSKFLETIPNFEFTPISRVVSEVCQVFLKEV
jgi:nucleoside-diphosphate-sugar epimerase